MSEIRFVQIPKSNLVFTINIPTMATENPLSPQDSVIIAFDNEVAELTDRIKKLEWIVTVLKEDGERMAKKFTANNAGFLMCIHCGQGMNTHSPDCAIELHRQLMKRIEEEEK